MIDTGRRACRSASKYVKSTEESAIMPDKDCIKIETNTLAKKTTIEWKINKQTIEIAKMSAKGDDKGVIGTSVDFGGHTFNVELCVPGWRRSQDGFSAFYLTVPQKATKKVRKLSNDNSI